MDDLRALKMVHGAIVAGVVGFAAVVFFLLWRGEGADVSAGSLRWVWLAAALACLFAAGWLRGRLTRDAPPDRVRRTAITIWALAEVPALLGLALGLVSGDRLIAAAGLVLGLMLLALHRPASFGASEGGR